MWVIPNLTQIQRPFDSDSFELNLNWTHGFNRIGIVTKIIFRMAHIVEKVYGIDRNETLPKFKYINAFVTRIK